VIEINQASLKQDGRLLLDGFSLTLPDPGLYLLAGKNGAGKSLIASLLAGRLKPQRGTVSIDGEPLYRLLGGYGAPVLYYYANIPLPQGLQLEEYLIQEISLLGGSYDQLKPYWSLLEETLQVRKSAPLESLASGCCMLAQLAIAAVAPVRLAVLDGQLAQLDQVHLGRAAELLHAMSTTDEKFTLLTALQPVSAISSVREVLILTGELPVQLQQRQAPVEEQDPAQHDAVLRLGLRDWIPGSRTVTSGQAFSLLSTVEDGLRIKLKGRLDEALAELQMQGLRVLRVEWED
jgi:ABC-type multidrug transport system ATPase subunit